MAYIYFDESKSKEGDFIIGSFVFCNENPDEFVFDVLFENGLFPGIDEFKSSAVYRTNENMKVIRSKLKEYFYHHCKFGLVVLPLGDIDKLGYEALKGLRQFIDANGFSEPNKIYFDEGIFKNKTKAFAIVESLGLNQNQFFFEQDSKEIRGIQLADLNAHCLTIMLKQHLGFINKMIKPGVNAGYSEDEEFPIGFEMLASLRFAFLLNEDPVFDLTGNELRDVCAVEPYGLFVSDLCSTKLAQKARDAFATVYLGCIH